MITLTGITLNYNQQMLINKLNVLATNLKPKLLFRSWFKSKGSVGFYIHGSVGSGKTMLLKAFFEEVECTKLLMHYQDFMRSIHSFIQAYGHIDRENMIEKLAKDYASRATLICLDEFEIKDIADAMIIGRLFNAFIKCGIYIVITTNTAPENLYKEGLQRELFFPFISMVQRTFDVFVLDSSHDYRLDRVSSKKRLLYPLNDATKRNMEEIKEHMIDAKHIQPETLKVFGRTLELRHTYKEILITDFTEMCQQNLSYNDYIVICMHFKTIIMENVPILLSENTDEAIRFINFIDSIYFHHNLLFISMETRPEELYITGKRIAEFKRTISRLHEIDSDEYFNFNTD